MNVRNLLRKLIGWDELDTRFVSADSARQMVAALSDEIERLRNQVDALKRMNRATPRTPQIPHTWEEVMAQFMSDSDQFKEQS